METLVSREIEFCPETVTRMTKYADLGLLFKQYTDKLKGEGVVDPFARRARLQLFTFHIKTSAFLSEVYEREYKDIHKYDRPIIGQQEVGELVDKIGWVQFIRAVEWYAVNRMNKLVRSGKLKYGFNQLTILTTKIRALPKWLK